MKKIYYEKIGRKYVPIKKFDLNGFAPGLYLIIENKDYRETLNMLHCVKVHDIQNVGKFADFYANYKEQLGKLIIEEYQRFFKENKEFSINDLKDLIISAMSKLK